MTTPVTTTATTASLRIIFPAPGPSDRGRSGHAPLSNRLRTRVRHASLMTLLVSRLCLRMDGHRGGGRRLVDVVEHRLHGELPVTGERHGEAGGRVVPRCEPDELDLDGRDVVVRLAHLG